MPTRACFAHTRDTPLILGNAYGIERWVLAYGEDTLTLRLTSELVDLRVGYANPFCFAKEASCRSVSANQKGNAYGVERGVLAYGEDTLTLRLTSELVDLRVGYANPFCFAKEASCRSVSANQKGNAYGVPFLIWRRERDSNPRVLSHKLISSQPRYDHFDISAYDECRCATSIL